MAWARGRHTGKAAGFGLALTLHALVVVYLSYEAGRLRPDFRYRDEVASVHIDLQQRPQSAPDQARPKPLPARRSRRPPSDEAAPAPFVTPNIGLGGIAAPHTAGGETDAGARARALKGMKDCTRLGMTRQERADCEESRWAKVEGKPELDIDPAGRYAAKEEPFLSRRPTDGCRGRMTGDVGAFGDDSNARAGLTCVKPF